MSSRYLTEKAATETQSRRSDPSVYSPLTQEGVHLTQEIRLVGFDDVRFALLLSIPLTTICHDEPPILEQCELRVLSTPAEIRRGDQLFASITICATPPWSANRCATGCSATGRWLAVARWSAAAFFLKDRDAYNGLTPGQCHRQPRPPTDSQDQALDRSVGARGGVGDALEGRDGV